MLNPQRLEFITRHFRDLQTIRFAPVPTAMVLALAAHRTPRVSPTVAREMLSGFLLCVAGFYGWSTVAIRRRYGSVKVSDEEARRMWRHPIIAALRAIFWAGLLWFLNFAPHTYAGDFGVSCLILIAMLVKILDPSNIASRRIAWAIGLVVLLTVTPFLADVEAGAGIISLFGAVWLSLSIFDFLLLRRTISEIAGSPPAEASEEVVRFG